MKNILPSWVLLSPSGNPSLYPSVGPSLFSSPYSCLYLFLFPSACPSLDPSLCETLFCNILERQSDGERQHCGCAWGEGGGDWQTQSEKNVKGSTLAQKWIHVHIPLRDLQRHNSYPYLRLGGEMLLVSLLSSLRLRRFSLEFNQNFSVRNANYNIWNWTLNLIWFLNKCVNVYCNYPT